MTIFGGQKNIEVMLEKYVGNNRSEFKIIEDELRKIVAIVNKKYKPLLTREELVPDLTSKELNTSDHNKLIEKLFKKLFNLKDFSMNWHVNAMANASTPCNVFLLVDPNYIRDNTGHQTNDKLFVGVNMYTGSITYANLNEKELLAIILHEIGHNFYNSVFQVLAFIPLTIADLSNGTKTIEGIAKFLAAKGIGDAFKIPQFVHGLQRKFYDYIADELPIVNKGLIVFNDLANNLLLVGGRVASPAAIKDFIAGHLNPLASIARYNVEKHADSFAVDYGYGKDLSSALNKMRLVEKTAKNGVYQIPGLNWFIDFTDLQISIVGSILSGYPLEQNRIKTNLDRLKRSAKDKSIDPRVRKEIEKQIKEFEDFYLNDYLDINSNENKNRIFTWMYSIAVEKVFGGKMDVRELVHAIDPHKYK